LNGEKKMKRIYSIRIFIPMAFNLIVFITGLLLCIVVFIYARNILRNDLYVRLNDLVYTIAKNIDGDRFRKVISKDDPESVKNYKIIQSRLWEIQKNTTGLFYIYSMRLNNKGENVFVVPTDDDRGFMNWLGVPYTEIHPEALKLYKKAGVVVIKDFIKDEYGTWVSGYASIIDSKGEIAGVVGIDVSAQDVIKSELRVLTIFGIITLVIVVTVILLGRFFSGMITNPLIKLQEEISMIQRLELDDVIPSNSIFIEIQDMENVVDRTKKALRSFKKYVPAELVNQIVITKKEAVLSGDKLEATFMFTDIQNFTTISESVEIEKLVEKMASYFKTVTSTIHKNCGTVDKYIGDAVMAFWGAPNYINNHAELACRTALQCLEKLRFLNTELEAEGFPLLNTRFGIHTGSAIIGNMGYEDRLNYTAVGDTVNTASRLEGINKYYGTNIIISDDTKEIIGKSFITRNLNRIIAKGKTHWITIHELLGERGNCDGKIEDFAEKYNLALDLFYKRQWKDAAALFSLAEKLRKGDIASLRMMKYCDYYMKNPPSENWKGIVKLNSK